LPISAIALHGKNDDKIRTAIVGDGFLLGTAGTSKTTAKQTKNYFIFDGNFALKN
jgi:hypothetical protein